MKNPGKVLAVSMVATLTMASCKSRTTTDSRSFEPSDEVADNNGGEGSPEVGLFAGGTAKPPRGGCIKGLCPPLQSPITTFFTPAGPLLPAAGGGSGVPLQPGADNGFQIIGQIQAVTLNAVCSGAPGQTTGGTVTLNGIRITVPSDTIVQFPANTLTFADSVCPGNNNIAGSSLAFDGSGGTPTPALISGGGQPSPVLPAIEMQAIGNIVGVAGGRAGVGSPYIASLLYASQMSANTGSGYIAAIDYGDGSIYVSSAGNGLTRLLINDPIGRYGRAQKSPDARFSVDTENPTIKSGSTGYPMCVPRSDPSVASDPRCPQRNRPTGSCRTFTQAGLSGQIGAVPFAGPFRVPGADLPAIPVGRFCTAFVMKGIQGMPGTKFAADSVPGSVNSLPLPVNEPDPREQAPFEVGDFITWQGTLVRGGNTPNANSNFPTITGDLVWVHTIDADVGIYTQPRTLPAYVAIGEVLVGVDPQPTGVAVLGVEATARLVLEANTTDVGSIIDIYFDDKGFEKVSRAVASGGDYVRLSRTANAEYYRWLTPESMTGTLGEQVGGKIPFATGAQPFGGGIETQYTGPQPGRARIRAIKIPAINATAPACSPSGTGNTMGCSITQSPTRYVRAVLRSLCAPLGTGDIDFAKNVVPRSNLDDGQTLVLGLPVLGNWFNINAPASGNPKQIGTGPAIGTCLEHAQFANGLYSGQYMAPVGEFIFPENTLAGRAIVPTTTYQMGFLVYGENGVGGGATAPQVPNAW